MFELFPSFLLYTFLSGILLAAISAPLGTFMVWQRQSYFGATLAHSALLGVSLALFLEMNITLGVILISVFIAFGIHFLQHRTQLSSDTLLGILAHSSLALGLVVLSLQTNVQIDLMSYLFGDILSVNLDDLIMLGGMCLAVMLFFMLHWQDLLNLTVNKSLASVEGTDVKRTQLYYVLLLALTIALAMKIVGVLLITALLIIPTAAARRLAHTPESMLAFSLILGVSSVLLGLFSSLWWDLPTGPAIVMAATLFFVLLLLKKQR